jgi:peptidoglycan/LPS O-acetylase OafA/YrhL
MINPRTPSYRPDIDGLRAIAVGAVLLFHLDRTWLPGGFIGVDIFFVISGYLITGILLKDIDSGNFSFLRFYRRRAARILPAQMVTIATTLVAGFFLFGAQDFASLGANSAAAAVSLINMKLIFQGSYFTISEDSQPLLHYWSLAVEEQFYVVFPALLFVLSLWGKWLRWVLLGLAVLSLVACITLTEVAQTWAFYLLPTRAWELLAGGMLVAFRIGEKPMADGLRNAFGLVGLGTILLALLLLDENVSFPGAVAVLPVAGTAMLLASGANETIVSRMLGARLPVAIGLISYSLYLWHWPVFSMVDYALFASSEGLRLVLKIALTVVLSVTGYLLIERPFRRHLREPRMGLRLLVGSLASICIVLVAGYKIRAEFYPTVDEAQIAEGGLVYGTPTHGRVVLVGDSQAAMYARQLSLLATRDEFELTILAKPAGNLLPNSPQSLWPQALKVIEHRKPDLVILVNAWTSKIGDDHQLLCQALSEIAPFARRALIITQPPTLPEHADRAALRNGSSPFFIEDPETAQKRVAVNRWISSVASSNVRVLDFGDFMMQENGSVGYVLPNGRAAFQDAGHLSDDGVAQLTPRLSRVILEMLASPTEGRIVAADGCQAIL